MTCLGNFSPIFMATVAIILGKCLFPVVTSKTRFRPVVIRKCYVVRAFLDLKKPRVAIIAFRWRCMLFVVKTDFHFALPDKYRCIINGVFIWRWFSLDMPHLQPGDTDMTSCALTIGSEGGFSLVSCATILTPVE